MGHCGHAQPVCRRAGHAYSDMTTNLIQPFWAIPILTVAGLRFGDIMGYCFILAGLMLLFNIFALLVIPLQL